MIVLLLVPGLISIILVLRGRIETAFLSVYLPCLLLLPQDYIFRLPHLPPLSAADFALIPLGIVGLSRLIRSGSFALMDLLVVLFVASVGLSEVLHAPILNNGILSAINAFVTMVLAYMVGRKLIEPDLRLATVRRFVILVLLDGPLGLYEWRMGQSLYGVFGDRVLGIATSGDVIALRGGHGRMGVVFSGGESAGIACAMTFCLDAWLVYLRRVKAPGDLGKTLTKLEKYHVPGLLLLLYVWLTQSRGPLIGLAAGYLILQIPRFKNARLATFVVAVLLIGGYTAAKAYFDSYTNLTYRQAFHNEQQQSAVYRREMNTVYAPIAEAGGWTGWGVSGIPHLQGKKSIDNHYLLVHLAWGLLAYLLFLLIAWENIRVLVTRGWRFKDLPDRAFAFSMLAAMAVLWCTLLTVYLGGQLPQICFLLIGWSQSLMASKTSSAPVEGVRAHPKLPFQRAFR
jgi:hypothetical protein